MSNADLVYWFIWAVIIVLCMLPLVVKLTIRISSLAGRNINKIPSIGCTYRVNRIIRSKFNAGDYEVVNATLCHYRFNIDGELVVMGILEINGAIGALKEFEHKKALG